MCKSIANGGQRCQAHTRQAVSDQMVSYTTALTPLNSEQTRAALRDLEIEGANLPDPEREEVDEWLERTITQVRYEPNLTEPRRERIIRRLREALGRVLPSGATFHAWKSIMAEAWQRSRRKAAIFFTVGVITFSGGCGLGAGGASPDDAPRGPSVVQVQDGYEQYAKDSVAAIEVPGDVASKFGAEDAQKAYDVAANTFLKAQVSDARVRISRADATTADFKDVRASLTAERRKDFDKALSCADTDADCYATVASIAYYGAEDNITAKDGAVKVRSDVPHAVVSKKVSKPTMRVSDDGRLEIRMTNTGTMRMKAAADNTLIPYENNSTVWMKKVDGQWKIDGWQTDWSKDAVATSDKA